MRNRLSLAVGLVVISATLASAQDPPSLPAPTDPVEVGRSAMNGKIYGSVDFGGGPVVAEPQDGLGEVRRFHLIRIVGAKVDEARFGAIGGGDGHGGLVACPTARAQPSPRHSGAECREELGTQEDKANARRIKRRRSPPAQGH